MADRWALLGFCGLAPALTGCELFIATYGPAPSDGAVDSSTPDDGGVDSPDCGKVTSLDINCANGGGFTCLSLSGDAGEQCVASQSQCAAVGGLIVCASKSSSTGSMMCSGEPCCVGVAQGAVASGTCPIKVSITPNGGGAVTECGDAGSCPSGFAVCTSNADCNPPKPTCTPAEFFVNGTPTNAYFGVCSSTP